MNEKKRIEEIKEGLKKSVYEQAAKIQVEHTDENESTERLSNILEGYVDKIDTIEADNMEELEEELRVLKKENVEVGSVEQQDKLVQEYNDYIHNDLDRTIAETVEYTTNLNNHTDDLNDILIRPMANEKLEDLEMTRPVEDVEIPEIAPDTDELFEIEATTDLGVFEDIVELESDTLDIEGTEVAAEVEIETEENDDSEEEAKPKKTKKEKVKKEKVKKEKTKSSEPKVVKNDVESDFEDEKGLAAFDYALIVILIIIFVILIALVAKINGVF